jgi:hypothetical protein
MAMAKDSKRISCGYGVSIDDINRKMMSKSQTEIDNTTISSDLSRNRSFQPSLSSPASPASAVPPTSPGSDALRRSSTQGAIQRRRRPAGGLYQQSPLKSPSLPSANICNVPELEPEPELEE